MTNSAGRRRRSAFAAGLAVMAMALGFTAIPAEATAPPKDVDYVAVGDSYTAGTGAGPFVPHPGCIQTAGGYVDIVGATSPVNLVANAACHGTFINWNDPNFQIPSVMQQIASLSAAGLLSRDTELVSLTAGANDAGVNAVIPVCSTSTETACKQAVASAVKLMPSVGANLARALAAIHRAAPNAKIAVLGYPRLFDPTGGAPIIPPANQVLVNQGTALLNATIATAVATAKVFYRANAQYIDVTARFRGHEVNSADPWIGLYPNPDPANPTPDPRNFHPNPAGHRAYADALVAAVNLPALARR
ncbi:SGNH/GDSL hydrolase family protein [Arthrobacter sp. B6]|uniref:SGNH/GDSL hydrolase family protein n=1 Tax=Arthrobacter sp. B6 TaxID=1570137 RepID=UPI00082DDBDC|nr:SGNH/GDSL hydrolase family protein [Arthrobacter sp. B6]